MRFAPIEVNLVKTVKVYIQNSFFFLNPDNTTFSNLIKIAIPGTNLKKISGDKTLTILDLTIKALIVADRQAIINATVEPQTSELYIRDVWSFKDPI